MAIAVETKSIGNVLSEAVKRLDAYRKALDARFTKAGETVRDKIKAEQMSGRKADNTGLNKISGTGHDSWQTLTDADNLNLTAESMVYNGPEADYLRYHEDGAGFNPKRLFVETGALVDYAENLYHEEAVSALGMLAEA